MDKERKKKANRNSQMINIQGTTQKYREFKY